jgi:DNA-binding Xre family transcriptional regulator
MLTQVSPMSVRFAFRKVVARKNVERADAGLPPLTQVEIARGSKVSQSVVSTLLAGKSRRIDLGTINGLCAFLGVTPGDLFEYIPDTQE